MTRLLVSVRNAAEARRALAGGADVIDVKEPRRGALGAADPAVWRDVVREVAGQAPVSVALGELKGFRWSREEFAQTLDGVAWAKIGLAGAGGWRDWQKRWEAAMATLPSHVRSVAVIYADWRQAESPAPAAVVEAALRAGVSTLLVDTFDKHSGNLLRHLSVTELQQLASRTNGQRLTLALAGSLRAELLDQIEILECDYVAVRGAVCSAGRESEVDEALVRHLSHCLRRERTCSASRTQDRSME